jgi:hypothetical protein
MFRRHILAIAAIVGLLVPLGSLAAIQWGHVIFDGTILWVWPTSYVLLANNAHPWLVIAISILVNVGLYVFIAFLGCAIFKRLRRISEQ